MNFKSARASSSIFAGRSLQAGPLKRHLSCSGAIAMLWDSPSSNVAFAVLAGFLTLLLLSIIRIKASPRIWDQIDTVGVSPRGGIFAWTFALLRSVTSMQEVMREGYDKFSKANKPFALPTMWVGGPIVVLPPSMLHFLNKPRTELSGFNALLENAQFRYLMTDEDVWGNTIHFDIVRKNLRQKDLGPLTEIISEEWDQAFQRCWGTSESGTVVNAWDSMVRIIARVASRVMVGLPGCRDENYLEQSRLYANAILVDACFINCLPPAVRPVAGRLLALRARYYQRKLLKILIPIVEERMGQYKDLKGSENSPGDMILWLIHVAESHGPDQMNAAKIAMRLLAMTAMIVFGIGWVFSHAVLDIYGRAASDDTIKILGTECRSVSDKFQGLSTQKATDSLYSVDSAIRESMRLSDLMVHLLPLDVVAGEQVDIGEGRRIAPGSGIRMVYPAQMVHLDPDIYQNPHTFDAFRFSRDHGSFEDSDQRPVYKRELMTTVSTSFLSFGYGRHACPGRWFVAQMVKQGLAYVLLNYNVVITKEPGARASLLNFMLPPQRAEILVSRKVQL